MSLEQRLADIRARVDAITPGPWTVMPEACGPEGQGIYSEELGHICEVGDPYPRGNNHPQENMTFIAHAPEDVRLLLAIVGDIRGAIDRDAFNQHLQRLSATVDAWPAWKKRALGIPEPAA